MKTLALILLLLTTTKLFANTYYFSSISGDDSHSVTEAQNQQTPWKTLDKLNSIMNTLAPGDIVSFKRSEIFFGSISVSRSGASNAPITFNAFGTGEKPVVSGFIKPSSWISVGNSVFESTSGSFNATLNTVIINGIPRAIGRYPNVSAPAKGYLAITTTNGSSEISGEQLAGSDWTNGEIVIRKAHWVIDRNSITSQSGSTINYNSQSPNAALAKYGFFIQNHAKTLDLDGEWSFNSAARKLSVFSTSGNPASDDIQASAVNTLVTAHYQNNIVFDNITFKGANINAFEINNSQLITIRNCDILYSGSNAFKGTNSSNIKVENSFIYYTNNTAFEFAGCSNVTISNNKIRCTGLVAGMGDGDSGSYEAILIDGNGHLVEFNEIDSTGYNPISFRGSYNIIRNNFINHFNTTKDDGGGIYSWNNIQGAAANVGSKITNNIVLNGIGASEGTPDPGYQAANGIYLDDNTSNVEVAGNTVAFCGLNGVYFHNAHEISFHNNTVFNNKSQIVLSEDNFAPNSPIRNITLNDNIFVSKENFQPVAEFLTENNDLSSFGSFDHNNYSRPTFDHFVINASYKVNGTYYNKAMDLQEWKNTYAKDLSSTKSPLTLTNTAEFRFEYNPATAPKTFSTADSYIDVNSVPYSGSITMQPYSSLVLLTKKVELPVAGCAGAGSIVLEEWENVGGNTIADIPLNQSPGRTISLPSIEFNNIGDNYASRMRGFLCPPQTGSYTFFLAGDDAAELWLSTSENPANKIRIATILSYTNFREWNKFPSQKSIPILLQAGTKYYIEVLQKEGQGGDNVSVAWQLPDGTLEAPIQGVHVVPFQSNVTPANQTISFPAISNKNVSDPPFSLAASSSSGLPVAFRVVSGPALVSNGTVTLQSGGTVVIEASQPGNSSFSAAVPVTHTFTVVTPVPSPCAATGSILQEVWTNVPGNNIPDIPVSVKPTTTTQITLFEGPENTADNYATRIRGYLCPPMDGNYTFWIAGDDATELWLSTNADPGIKTRIAYGLSWTFSREWKKFPTQQSTPVFLQAGKKYYIEALHKEGAGGDNVAVAWQLPNGIMEAPIPGSRLSPYSAAIGLSNQSIIVDAISDVTVGVPPFSINASASSGLPVTLKVVSGPATIAGNTVSIIAAGTVSIEASQPGNASYNAAPVVQRSFVVSAAIDNDAPVIIPRNITVTADINGIATIRPADVIQAVTDASGVDEASITISQSLFTCPSSNTGTGVTHQAFTTNKTNGVQNYGGELGLSFRVNSKAGISINQLGAFDDKGNGITGSQSGGIRVAIFNAATKTLVPGLDAIIIGNADSYTGSHRMKNITAVILLPGDYVLVAKGYNQNELNGNSSLGSPPVTGDLSDGAISYIPNNLYGDEGTGFGFPKYFDGSTNYLAGTFGYVTVNTTSGNIGYQAYTSSTKTGVQNYGGELGLEFKVNNAAGITINQLGAFDNGGDGISGTQSGGVRVAVFNKATKSIVAGLDAIIIGNADNYSGNHRMKNILPVTLVEGNYLIVAKGYNQNELNGNSSLGSPGFAGNSGNGAISFVSSSSYGDEGSGFNFPAYPDDGTNYLAGTFSYFLPNSRTTANINTVSITARDNVGNLGQANATVTVQCNQPLARVMETVARASPGIEVASIPEVVTGSVKVFPNPTNGRFSVQLTGIKAPSASIEILNESGATLKHKTIGSTKRLLNVKTDFDISNYSNGIYLLKVVSAAGTQSKKLVLIK